MDARKRALDCATDAHERALRFVGLVAALGLIVAARTAMAPPPAMQREAIGLAAILETVRPALLVRRLGRLRRAAGDEGRKASFMAVVLRPRLALLVRLPVALLALLIVLVLARRERLRVLRQIGLRLTGCVGRLERLVLVVALLEPFFRTRLELLVVAAFLARLEIRILLPELLLRGG